MKRSAQSRASVSWDLTIRPNPGAEMRRDAVKEDKTNLDPQSRLRSFEETVMPHLDAAHNLARWMMRNDEDARDVVQESCLRAFRFFDNYRGGDVKSWLLTVVRNTCHTWLRRRNRETGAVPFDEALHGGDHSAPHQERSIAAHERTSVLRSCMESLPAEFREVVIMRELEEMSYREIAGVTGLPVGTVMSRLSRARKRLAECAAGAAMEAAR